METTSVALYLPDADSVEAVKRKPHISDHCRRWAQEAAHDYSPSETNAADYYGALMYMAAVGYHAARHDMPLERDFDLNHTVSHVCHEKALGLMAAHGTSGNDICLLLAGKLLAATLLGASVVS